MGVRLRKAAALLVLVGAALGTAGVASASADGNQPTIVLAGNSLCC